MRLERTRQNFAILQYSTVPGVDPFLSTKALTNPKNPRYIAIWQGFHQLNTLRCFTSVTTSSTSGLSCGVNSDKECYNGTYGRAAPFPIPYPVLVYLWSYYYQSEVNI